MSIGKLNYILTFIVIVLLGLITTGPLSAHASVHNKKLQKLIEEIHDADNMANDQNTALNHVTGLKYWSNPRLYENCHNPGQGGTLRIPSVEKE